MTNSLLAATSILIVLGLTACASNSVPQESTESPYTASAQSPAPPARTQNQQVEDESIDVTGLRRSLGLERPIRDLGFEERGFNTCNAGYGFSASRDCRAKSLVTIHFRLQCRDSEGTVSNVDYEVEPVVSDQVKWNLGPSTGMTSTDLDGFGQIVYLAGSAQANQKLRLTVDGHFLIMTAAEIRRLIVPKFWCANAHR